LTGVDSSGQSASAGEQVTIREWVEERDKVMAATVETHRAETRLDIANLAKEFGKELRDGLQAAQQEAKKARDDDRAEAKKARDDDRAEARAAKRWTWALIVGVGLAVIFSD